MKVGYTYPPEVVDSVRRMVKMECESKEDVFVLARIANVDYRTLMNLLEYYPLEYRELMKVNGWGKYRYPTMVMLERIVKALGCELLLSVVKRG